MGEVERGSGKMPAVRTNRPITQYWSLRVSYRGHVRRKRHLQSAVGLLTYYFPPVQGYPVRFLVVDPEVLALEIPAVLILKY